MVDITSKINSLRKAVAIAEVHVSSQATIDAVEKGNVPKGDIREFSRAAGLLAIKKTSDVIPDCHPLPVEFASIKHTVSGLTISIRVEVHTIYKTGVEVEAMHGAAITALTIYDMLKPIDKGVSIGQIRLEQKSGGKTDFRNTQVSRLRCAVIVCSDTVAAGQKEDRAGKAIIQRLEKNDLSVESYQLINDDKDGIQAKLRDLHQAGFDLIIFTGGTGLSPRDNTPDAISPLLDRPVPGIMEAARSYGQQRTPYAMLSRSVAGFMGKSLVLALPGSTGGATESMDALFPHILHIFHIAEGGGH